MPLKIPIANSRRSWWHAIIYNNCRDSFDAVNESFLNNSLGWGLSESFTINPIESDEENDLRSLPPTPFRVVEKTENDEPYERILPVDDAPVRVKEEGNAPVKIPNGGDIREKPFAVRPTRQNRPEMGNAKVNAANARKKKTTRTRSTPLKDITNKSDREVIKKIAGKKRPSARIASINHWLTNDTNDRSCTADVNLGISGAVSSYYRRCCVVTFEGYSVN